MRTDQGGAIGKAGAHNAQGAVKLGQPVRVAPQHGLEGAPHAHDAAGQHAHARQPPPHLRAAKQAQGSRPTGLRFSSTMIPAAEQVQMFLMTPYQDPICSCNQL